MYFLLLFKGVYRQDSEIKTIYGCCVFGQPKVVKEGKVLRSDHKIFCMLAEDLGRYLCHYCLPSSFGLIRMLLR